jgi:hypothetical protein
MKNDRIFSYTYVIIKNFEEKIQINHMTCLTPANVMVKIGTRTVDH